MKAEIGQLMSDEQAMKLAIEQAQRGFGHVEPNPPVGCVILDKNSQFLASGYHHTYGKAHAEVDALSKVSKAELRGARVYITLEPCAHHGKTPPCATRLASLPVSEVFYGVKDPNPLVSGQGIAILREARIKVSQLSSMVEDCEELAETFLYTHREKAPFIALKVASSIDGQIGLSSGESKWITNELSREFSHHLRARYEAVLIGANTFLKDNPKLNVRLKEFENKQNKVVVVSGSGRVLSELKDSNLLSCRNPNNVFVLVGQNAKVNDAFAREIGVQVVRVEEKNGTLTSQNISKSLFNMGVRSIFVEGGATVYSTFLSQSCVQRLYCFVAPKIIGSTNGLSWTKDLNISNLNENLRLKSVRIRSFHNDVLITSRF